MSTLLHVLGLVTLFGVCLLALASLLFGLPGTFIIVGAALALRLTELRSIVEIMIDAIRRPRRS